MNKRDTARIKEYAKEYEQKNGHSIEGDKRSNEWKNTVANMILRDVERSILHDSRKNTKEA